VKIGRLFIHPGRIGVLFPHQGLHPKHLFRVSKKKFKKKVFLGRQEVDRKNSREYSDYTSAILWEIVG
jgi:hypothetical protein